MEFINLLDNEGIIKKELSGADGDDKTIAAVIKHKKISTLGDINNVDFGYLKEHKPTVRLHQRLGKVVQIEFICHCGETATVDIDYDAMKTSSGEFDA